MEAAFFSHEDRGIAGRRPGSCMERFLAEALPGWSKYEACAYAHFLSYGLELQERQEYELKAADMGNLFHCAIDTAFKRAAERGRRLQDMDSRERDALADEAVEEAVSGYSGDIMKEFGQECLSGRQGGKDHQKNPVGSGGAAEEGGIFPRRF